MAETMIFSEQIVEGFAYNADVGFYMQYFSPKQFVLETGKEYRVIWDGAEYTCIAYEGNYLGMTYTTVYLGNELYVTGQSSEIAEPFVIYYVADTDFNNLVAADENTSHIVAIYEVEEESGEDNAENGETTSKGCSIVLYDRTGQAVTYEGVETITTDTPVDGERATFTRGVLMDGAEIELSMAAGDQEVFVPDGYLIKKATLKKPETLLPEYIKKNIEIAGVLGEFAGDEMEKTVDLAMAGGDQVIDADEDTVLTKVTVRKPDTLMPENIVKSVNIGGVIGTFESPPTSKAINFYDHFGNLYASYTRAEAQLLEELPVPPELDGFEFDAWTHTLDDVKNAEFFLDVGPAYKKDGVPVTILILYIPPENLTINLCLYMWSTSYKVKVDWGDGTTTAVTGTSNGLRNNSHTYTKPGIKFVSIAPTVTGTQCGLGRYNSKSSYTCVSDSASIVNPTYTYWTPAQQLLAILANEYDTSMRYDLCYFRSCYNLKFISYRHLDGNFWTPGFDQYACKECISLRHIASNFNFNIGAYDSVFESCGIERLALGTAVGGTAAFKNCPNLTDLICRGTSISHKDINQSHRLILTNTTPPTISNSSPLYGTKNIYVPDDALETYKAADGWSNIAEYIKPASEYPDY